MDGRSGLQGIVDGLCERLGRSVAIDDPRIRLLAYSAQIGPTDAGRVHSIMQMSVDDDILEHIHRHPVATATAPVRVEGVPERGILGRWCFPVRCQGLLFGYLWIIDDASELQPAEQELCQEAAATAGELLMRTRLVDDERRQREEQAVLGLLDPAGEVRAATHRSAVRDRLYQEADVCCALAVPAPTPTGPSGDGGTTATGAAHLLRRVAARLAPLRVLVGPVGGADVAVLVLGARAALERHLPDAAALLAAETVRLGVGSVRPSVLEAADSLTEARTALRVGRHLAQPVARWESLGVYQLLGRVPEGETGAVPAPVLALLQDDNADQLVGTLLTYLDVAGSPQRAAERLRIHRSSLYHRLQRIETVTGLSLAEGEHRLLLHLGLKLAALQGLGLQGEGRSADHGGRGGRVAHPQP